MNITIRQAPWGYEASVAEETRAPLSALSYEWQFSAYGVGKTEEEARNNLSKALDALVCELP